MIKKIKNTVINNRYNLNQLIGAICGIKNY